MTDKELMQQALYALEQVAEYFNRDSTEAKAIAALRERLAQPSHPYPDNFIDALKYDVAKRDSEAQQAYEDAFINGTGVILGDKRIDPASVYKQPEQEPVAYKITGKLGDICSFHGGANVKKGDLVYTTPPQRKPLSGYINSAGINANDSPYTVVWKLERAIEAAHGIK